MRKNTLSEEDILSHRKKFSEVGKACRFLVIGDDGSIEQAATLEIFKRDPRVLHLVDISKNSIIELARNIRSILFMVQEIFVHLQLIELIKGYFKVSKNLPVYIAILCQFFVEKNLQQNSK